MANGFDRKSILTLAAVASLCSVIPLRTALASFDPEFTTAQCRNMGDELIAAKQNKALNKYNQLASYIITGCDLAALPGFWRYFDGVDDWLVELCLRYHPQESHCWFLKGRGLISGWKLAEAEAALERALALSGGGVEREQIRELFVQVHRMRRREEISHAWERLW